MNKSQEIHETADVQSHFIGKRTHIWQYVVVLPNARIGSDVNICAHCFIENDVEIGDRVTIKSGVYLWDGVHIGDDVFIGPNVTFTNDKFPKSKVYPEKFQETRVENGASIGGGAVLLPGITIGRGAMVAAGTVVTQSVPPHAIVMGSPARITRYIENATTSVQSETPTPSERPAPARVGVGNVTLHYLKLIQDPRGKLSVAEFPKEIPFEPKRYFLIFDVPGKKIRGQHAHYKCHQFLICVKGHCAVLVDDGKFRREVSLDSPDTGIHLPPLTWGSLYKFSTDAVLLVFASDYYQAGDYIQSYTQFLDIVQQVKEST